MADSAARSRWSATRVPAIVASLLDRSRDALGDIDVYCANAGIVRGGGSEASDAVWEASWHVNVMAHVRAARLLLPEWLDRGGGRLVWTVSAAGLLTMIGAASYSATKHAALRVRRVAVVHVPPPRSDGAGDLSAGGAHRDAGTAPTGSRAMLADSVIEPEAVADAVMKAIDDDRFLILPHPEVAAVYPGRAADPDQWLAGMNKIQRYVEDLLA